METTNRLTQQETEIHWQRRRIAESLRYASLIQKAVFPSRSIIRKHFPNHFLLLIPKDILSGDFYWLYQKNGKIYFAVADCTGHGVPGALMSVMGISFLNEQLAQPRNLKANQLLNKLREKVMKALGQTGSEDISEDGMDIAMCLIDERTGTLQYSGANSPLYLIRNGELLIFRPDRMPVGIHIIEERSFTNYEIELEDGDLIYLFSDGFPDQIGGDKNKKFMSKNFRDLLMQIHTQPMDKQKDILKRTFLDWKGDRKQIDDILVMGVKYSKTNQA